MLIRAATGWVGGVASVQWPAALFNARVIVLRAAVVSSAPLQSGMMHERETERENKDD